MKCHNQHCERTTVIDCLPPSMESAIALAGVKPGELNAVLKYYCPEHIAEAGYCIECGLWRPKLLNFEGVCPECSELSLNLWQSSGLYKTLVVDIASINGAFYHIASTVTGKLEFVSSKADCSEQSLVSFLDELRYTYPGEAIVVQMDYCYHSQLLRDHATKLSMKVKRFGIGQPGRVEKVHMELRNRLTKREVSNDRALRSQTVK